MVLSLAVLGIAAGPALAAGSANPVLQVGVVDGSQPCSFRVAGSWHGIAVDLWSQIAQREAIPYVLQPMPSIQAMLEATRKGQLDVAVECVNLSPDRLRRYRFSLPFQEDGQAVMVTNNPVNLSQAFLSALFSDTLQRLLVVLVCSTLALSACIWGLERPPQRRGESWRLQLRDLSRVFTALFTGSGDEALTTLSRGRVVLLLGYLLRIIASALLVSYLTVAIVKETQGRASHGLRRLSDLAGLRVGLKPGSVSEALIDEINHASGSKRATVVPITTIEDALPALERHRIDVMLADQLQLQYLIATNGSTNLIPTLALSRIRPELQGFALSPTLPESVVKRINLAISELKRSGEFDHLRANALDANERFWR